MLGEIVMPRIFASPARSASPLRKFVTRNFRRAPLRAPHVLPHPALAEIAFGVHFAAPFFRFMTRLFAFLLLLFCATARAGELSFDTYFCALTIPEGEEWQRGIPQRIEGGDTIFQAAHGDGKEFFAVCVLPNVPALDLSNEGLPSYVLRTLGTFGFQSTPPKLITGKDISFLQFIAKRPESAEAVCVARAALRNKTLYLLLMIGRGGPERAEDKHFMRIMDSFHFLDPDAAVAPLTANPLFNKYRLGAYACAGLVLLLALLFAGVMYFTRRSYH